MRQQLADVPCKQGEHSVLVWGQLHGLAGHRDGSLLEVDPQLPDLDDGLGRVGSAPQRRAQTREHLVDAERLGHVVVGSGVERRHLLALVADRGEDDHRDVAPAPQLPAMSVPVPSGSRRSRMTASGGRMAASASACSTDAAVVTSYPAPRRFVWSARRICGSSSTTRILAPVIARTAIGGGARESQHERGALAGRFRPEAAPVRLGEAARDREPEPGARRPPRRARTARTRPRRRQRACPGPSSATRTTTVSPFAVAVDADVPRRSRMAVGVLQEVDEDPPHLPCVDLDRGEIGRHVDRGAAVVMKLVERRADELVHRPELALRIGGARLQPREIEEVAHHPIEAGRLDPDRLDERRTIAVVELKAGLSSPPAAAAIAVSGERRSCETARSTVVLIALLRRRASASSASRSSSSRSIATASSDASAGRNRRTHRVVCRSGRRRRERADPPSVDLEREGDGVGERPSPRHRARSTRGARRGRPPHAWRSRRARP